MAHGLSVQRRNGKNSSTCSSGRHAIFPDFVAVERLEFAELLGCFEKPDLHCKFKRLTAVVSRIPARADALDPQADATGADFVSLRLLVGKHLVPGCLRCQLQHLTIIHCQTPPALFAKTASTRGTSGHCPC